jgi:hypothetical protein
MDRERPLPRRVGFDGARPNRGPTAAARHGELPRPSVVTPVSGAVFTANNRTLPAAQAAEVSRMDDAAAGVANPELLAARDALGRDSLAMQLDTRARGYDQLRDIVLEVVPADERIRCSGARAARHIGTATRISISPDFGSCTRTISRCSARDLPLLAPAVDADPAFSSIAGARRRTLRRLLDERPPLAHARVRDLAGVPARRSPTRCTRSTRTNRCPGSCAVERRNCSRSRIRSRRCP